MSASMPYQAVINTTRFGPSMTLAANGGVLNFSNLMDLSYWDEVTFYVFIHSVSGSPTSGSLTAKIQFGGLYAPASGRQYGAALLTDIEAGQITALMPEGDWPASLADYNLSTAKLVRRTVKNPGSICNLKLDASTLSGGTTPYFSISVGISGKKY